MKAKAKKAADTVRAAQLTGIAAEREVGLTLV